MFGQGVKIGSWFVVKTLQVRISHELEKILIAGEVAGERPEVKNRLSVVGAALPLQAGTLDQVEFASDYRLDPFRFRA